VSYDLETEAALLAICASAPGLHHRVEAARCLAIEIVAKVNARGIQPLAIGGGYLGPFATVHLYAYLPERTRLRKTGVFVEGEELVAIDRFPPVPVPMPNPPEAFNAGSGGGQRVASLFYSHRDGSGFGGTPGSLPAPPPPTSTATLIGDVISVGGWDFEGPRDSCLDLLESTSPSEIAALRQELFA
jgi:hypothetical protein